MTCGRVVFYYFQLLVALATLVSGCSPTLIRPITETPNSSSQTTASVNIIPFSANWPFDAGTEASYTFDSSKIDFSAGVCRLTPLDQLDDTNTATGFSGGTHYGTAWNAGTSTVTLANAGGCDATSTNCSELDSSWTPQYSNLIAYWKMNNNWNDSFSTNNGTAANNAIFTTSSKLGSHSGNFSSTNTNDYISVPRTAALSPTTAITVGFWFKGNAQGNYKYQLCMSGDGGAASYGFYTGGSGGLFFYISTGDLTVYLTPDAGTSIWDNRWHYAVGTYDKVKLRLYVDGKEISTGTVITDNIYYQNTNDLFFGSYDPSVVTSTSFKGQLDDFAIWNVRLTADEIQMIYNRQSSRFAGTYTSRIMDVGSWGAGTATWTELAWTPTLPFAKELTDYTSGSVQNEISADYSALTTDTLMTGNVGLWHLNESSWNGTADEVKNDSSVASHGTAVNGAAITTNGKFGNAGEFDGTNDYLDLGNSATYKFSISDPFTVSAWIRPTLDSTDRIIFSNSIVSGNAPGYHMRITSSNTLRFIVLTTNSIWRYSDSSPLTSGWHHVVGTWDGSNIKTYVDGVLDSTTFTQGVFVNMTSTANLFLGSHTDGGWYFKGNIDEAAIWSRTLGPTEILQLYQRGASRLKYQIRTCDDNACSGESWQGPDNTNATYFSEFNNNTVPNDGSGLVKKILPTMLFSNFGSLTVSNNRYFQYRAIFETDDASVSNGPELKNVSIGPAHYDGSSPTIYNNTGIAYTNLSTFAETLGSCSGGVTYTLSKDKVTWYYWTGATWAAANGTAAQSNTATTINSNISSLSSVIGTGSFYFKAFLNSSGLTRCELDSTDITGNQ